MPEADEGGDVAVVADWQNHIWAGTLYRRFYKFDLDTRQTTAYELDPADTSGFPSSYVGHAWLDRKNRQWFGYDKGLFLMLPGAEGAPVRFRRFTEEDGLAGSHVVAIREDKQGNLWVSTNNGLSKFDPGELSEQGAGRLFFRNYKAADGLQSDEFTYHSSHADARTGELFFGGTNGFNVFRPDKINDDSIPPKVVITEIKVLRNNEMVSMPFDPANPAPLRLTHLEKLLTIEFAALHFANPERNGYACKLEGFDEDWRYLGNQHEVTYTNLDAGNYTFRVKACNKDGVWNEQGISLKIKVLPPWWRTWWAYLTYVLLLGTAAYFFYQFQLKRKLEHAEAERIKELDALKTRLYTNITHEFRTPLTVILGMVENIRGHENERKLIHRNSQNLLRLINQMLDLAKLDAGSLGLQLIRGDLVNYLQYLTESFYSMAAEKKVRLTFYSETPELLMDYDEEKIQHIVYNLLSNALKFTGEGGKVVLHVRVSPLQSLSRNVGRSGAGAGQPFLQLKVQDTGVGIPVEQLPHIFDRFYQGGQTAKVGGTGIGLALTKELVGLMGGEVSVESRTAAAGEGGSGTTFTVLLPIRQESPMKVVAAESRIPAAFAPEITETILSQATEAAGAAEGEKPVLLVVEDNPDVVAYLTGLLGKTYETHVATDGRAGIEKALELVPDIIISDVMMPEKDGYEVCETLKNDERTSHIPIILLTAKATDADRLTGLRRGADAYLMKPFNKEELFVRLKKLVELRRRLQERYAGRRNDIFEKNVISETPSEPTLEDLFLQKIRQAIEAKMDDTELGIVHLCRAASLSHTQLFRKLKALTGLNPTLFIRKVRLQRAAELLKTTELNVSEIAYEVGFSDPNYFSRAFHEEYGRTPSEERR
jgi:signal transduction histidine kinase/DNA-binding response OmpR family regulator